MIKKSYIDLAFRNIGKRGPLWLFKKSFQYFTIYASYIIGRPLCRPILAMMAVTYDCNFNCKMCNVKERGMEYEKENKNKLSTEELKGVIKSYAELGVSVMIFTGGEPLLREDIFELISYAGKNGLITHLNTNASLLSRENIAKLLAANIDSISISLDGSNSKTHDEIRGFKGSYNRILEAISHINDMKDEKKLDTRLEIVSTLSESNISEVGGIIQLAEGLNVDSVEFLPEQGFYKNDDTGPANACEAFQEKVNKTVAYLLKEKRHNNKIENSNTYIKLLKKSFNKQKSPLKCHVGYHTSVVDCYGELYPCIYWFHKNKSIANIKHDNMRDIWYSKRYNAVRKELAECRDCYVSAHTELNILFNIKSWFN